MGRELRKIFVVSFDGCIHDGGPAEYGVPNSEVISIIQREREQNKSVFIMETRNNEFRSDFASVLHGWGLGFAFYNVDPQVVLHVLNSEFDCKVIRWDRVEDVLCSDYLSVCKEYAADRDIFTLCEGLQQEIGNLVHTLDAGEFHHGNKEHKLAEEIAYMRFALDTFEQAMGIADLVREKRSHIISGKRDEILRDRKSSAEGAE